MNNSLYIYLYKELLTKTPFNYNFENSLQGKGNRRKIFDSFIEIVKKEFESKESNKMEFGNVFVYFSSSACSGYYFLLKRMWFNVGKDSTLSYDVLLNYLKEKFKLDNGGEEELINIVNDFSNSY